MKTATDSKSDFNTILHTVKAIIILDVDGNRVLSKHYDVLDPSIEKKIYSKTHRTRDEILVIDGLIVLHEAVVDLHFYVLGPSNENPIILMNVLKCIHGGLSILLRNQIERKVLMDNVDQFIIFLDEICDSGVIIETDSSLAVQRVALKEDMGDITLGQILMQAKEQFSIEGIGGKIVDGSDGVMDGKLVVVDCVPMTLSLSSSSSVVSFSSSRRRLKRTLAFSPWPIILSLAVMMITARGPSDFSTVPGAMSPNFDGLIKTFVDDFGAGFRESWRKLKAVHSNGDVLMRRWGSNVPRAAVLGGHSHVHGNPLPLYGLKYPPFWHVVAALGQPTGQHIVPYNIDVLIAIGARLFVIESDNMANFVHHNIEIGAPGTDRDVLTLAGPISLAPDERPTTGCVRSKPYKQVIVHLSLPESQARVLAPMLNGLFDDHHLGRLNRLVTRSSGVALRCVYSLSAGLTMSPSTMVNPSGVTRGLAPPNMVYNPRNASLPLLLLLLSPSLERPPSDYPRKTAAGIGPTNLQNLIVDCFVQQITELIVLILVVIHWVEVVDSGSSVDHCYTDIGCFPITPDLYHPRHRPINVRPWHRDRIRTTFTLYNLRSVAGHIMRPWNDLNLENSNFDPQLETKIIIPGWLDNIKHTLWVKKLKDAFLFSWGPVNIIVIQWTNFTPYTLATANCRVVGAEIANLLKFIESRYAKYARTNYHLIGHSLGAHIAAYCGDRLPGLGRITALDPARPFFEGMPKSVRLDRDDAKFVDVIHSDFTPENAILLFMSFGMTKPVGHVDFFPNGPQLLQPGCIRDTLFSIPNGIGQGWAHGSIPIAVLESIRYLVACDHQRSHEWFIESVLNRKCKFVGLKCTDMDGVVNGRCSCDDSPDACAIMGIHADQMYVNLAHKSRHRLPQSSSANNRQTAVRASQKQHQQQQQRKRKAHRFMDTLNDAAHNNNNKHSPHYYFNEHSVPVATDQLPSAALLAQFDGQSLVDQTGLLMAQHQSLLSPGNNDVSDFTKMASILYTDNDWSQLQNVNVEAQHNNNNNVDWNQASSSGKLDNAPDDSSDKSIDPRRQGVLITDDLNFIDTRGQHHTATDITANSLLHAQFNDAATRELYLTNNHGNLMNQAPKLLSQLNVEQDYELNNRWFLRTNDKRDYCLHQYQILVFVGSINAERIRANLLISLIGTKGRLLNQRFQPRLGRLNSETLQPFFVLFESTFTLGTVHALQIGWEPRNDPDPVKATIELESPLLDTLEQYSSQAWPQVKLHSLYARPDHIALESMAQMSHKAPKTRAKRSLHTTTNRDASHCEIPTVSSIFYLHHKHESQLDYADDDATKRSKRSVDDERTNKNSEKIIPRSIKQSGQLENLELERQAKPKTKTKLKITNSAHRKMPIVDRNGWLDFLFPSTHTGSDNDQRRHDDQNLYVAINQVRVAPLQAHYGRNKEPLTKTFCPPHKNFPLPRDQTIHLKAKSGNCFQGIAIVQTITVHVHGHLIYAGLTMKSGAIIFIQLTIALFIFSTITLSSGHLLDDILEFVSPKQLKPSPNKSKDVSAATTTNSVDDGVLFSNNKAPLTEPTSHVASQVTGKLNWDSSVLQKQVKTNVDDRTISICNDKEALDEINLNVRTSLMVMQIIQSQQEQQLQSLSANMRLTDYKLDRILAIIDELKVQHKVLVARYDNVDPLRAHVMVDKIPITKDDKESLHQRHSSPISNSRREPTQTQVQFQSTDSNVKSTSHRANLDGPVERAANPQARDSAEHNDDFKQHDQSQAIVAEGEKQEHGRDDEATRQFTSKIILPWPVNQLQLQQQQNDTVNSKTQHSMVISPQQSVAQCETEKFIVMSGSVNESLSHAVSDEVASVIKQWHSGTRNQINKLINKAFDHSSQFNSLYDLLLEIKDECSASTLAMSTLNSPPTKSPALLTSNLSTSPILSEQALYNNDNNNNNNEAWTLKSSEISLLTHIIHEIGANQSVDTRNLVNETRHISKHVAEINSIVKQVALIVSRLQASHLHDTGDGGGHNTVVTYEPASTSAQSVPPNSQSMTRSKSTSADNSNIDLSNNSNNNNTQVIASIMNNNATNQTTAQLLSDEPHIWMTKCNSASHVIAPKSCHDLARHGANCSGIYFVYSTRGNVQRVYCEFDVSTGVGWTLLARRIDRTRAPVAPRTSQQRWPKRLRSNVENELIKRLKSFKVSFDQDWRAYKDGFGHLDEWGEFWLGLSFIHKLTTTIGANASAGNTESGTGEQSGAYVELQIDLEASDGDVLHLMFDAFKIDNESNKFKLTLGLCNDTRGHEFARRHNGTTFWTYDRPSAELKHPADPVSSSPTLMDNGTTSANNYNDDNQQRVARACARQIHAGWWFDSDHMANIGQPCHSGLITGPTATDESSQAADTVASTSATPPPTLSSSILGLRWPTWKDGQPLYRITMKVRPKEGVTHPLKSYSSATIFRSASRTATDYREMIHENFDSQ
ncbi:Inactive pancreatic lipase-related protein 1 [Fragariocoptes setiger]|uniref:Inactive pancreatic lipase-related protein 1 n=1 Tax=Fragariocoptes setiger TaxID=1670756 RepID=A0ABQ7SA90_9ACAR|nr:Inactive pancreatic lipase-related protein 1 [Fragariocoptes setiger]